MFNFLDGTSGGPRLAQQPVLSIPLALSFGFCGGFTGGCKHCTDCVAIGCYRQHTTKGYSICYSQQELLLFMQPVDVLLYFHHY